VDARLSMQRRRVAQIVVVLEIAVASARARAERRIGDGRGGERLADRAVPVVMLR